MKSNAFMTFAALKLSPSARRARIEIIVSPPSGRAISSPSARRARIEITQSDVGCTLRNVALHKEGAD